MIGTHSVPPPVAWGDPATAAELGAVLRGIGFTGPGVSAILGGGEAISSSAEDVAGLLTRVGGGSALATVIRLLLFGLPVGIGDARRALAPVPIESLARQRLLAGTSSTVRATCRIIPYQHLLVACDWPARAGATRRDHVPGVHASSVLLANLTPRTPVAHTLDLGCGCGIQGLLAAAHSERVTALDVNPRALAFSAFPVLNGIHNMQCHEGHLYGPVNGRSYDLVVCNPPYVISPRARARYRDAGGPAGELCRRIVRETPGALTAGGLGCVLVSWAIRRGEDPAAALRAWVADLSCDCLLLVTEVVTPLANAVRWIDMPASASLARRHREVSRWLAAYRAAGIEAIGYGAVILRERGPGGGWLHIQRVAGMAGPAGHHVQRLLAGQDHLAGPRSPESILDCVYRTAPDVLLEQSMGLRAGTWHPLRSALALHGGLLVRVPVNPAGAALVSRLDGSCTVRSLVAEDSAGPAAAAGGEQALSQAAMSLVAQLVAAGLVLPVSG